MNLGRIFANAIVRRLAYVLVAIALAWCGIGRAEAAVCGYPTRAEASVAAGAGQLYEYEGQARAACESTQQWVSTSQAGVHWIAALSACVADSFDPKSFRKPGVFAGQPRIVASTCATAAPAGGGTDSIVGWKWTNPGCPPGQGTNPDGTCDSCDSKPPLGPSAWSNVNVSQMMCKDECVYEGGAGSGGVGVCFDQVIDGQRYTRCTSWGTTGDSCSVSGPGSSFPGAPSSAPTDSDGDGTSDDNDGAPNNPGQGGGGNSDGEGPPEDGSGTCGGEGQPVCGSAGTGSGNGNTSGGGGDCNTPPTSTGDAILAQIAYQTWATRCAITGAGNAGPGGGTGTGEGSGSGGEVDGDAEGRDAAMDGSENDPERDDVVEEAPSEEDGELDTSGYGYSRACVASPTVSVFGQTITFDTGPMCQWLELGSYFVLLLAALASARIIGGGMA